MNLETKKIIIISDSTGKTAKRLMDAVLAQYADKKVNYEIQNIFQNVRDEKQLQDILKNINNDYLVIFSLITKSLQRHFEQMLEERGFMYLNVLEPMLSILSKFLGVHPDYKPGLLHVVDDKYYEKIDSISYTVEHDDGRGHNMLSADIILLGLSRTCKTPISMYLACNFGLKVVNIPIVPVDNMKETLMQKLQGFPSEKIFGLMMDPDILMQVREERSRLLGGDRISKAGLGDYYDPRKIREEVKFCRMMFVENNWKMVDVTKRAIEEISTEILVSLNLKFKD
ncbi:MAG: pyruvate, water dikinase regulatory protein [Candidatus Zixiibacteriota bacterium]